MLVRIAKKNDVGAWQTLARQVSPIFGVSDMSRDNDFNEYINTKIDNNEAIIALDRMSRKALGFIGFSKKNNRISWFAVDENYRNKGIGSKLLKCAINQLDWDRDISVVTFKADIEHGLAAVRLYEKFGFKVVDDNITDNFGNIRCKMTYEPKEMARGGSFHYNYDRYHNWSSKKECPVCKVEESSDPPVLIKELDYSWAECCKQAQGRLFGKIHILSKVHSEHFYDMDDEDMTNFMSDVKIVAKALHEATGAVKINYEIHGNSMPHLHVHLFPRYLDDDFPSKPIDYNLYEPSPYESNEEYDWFVNNMRKLLE